MIFGKENKNKLDKTNKCNYLLINKRDTSIYILLKT